MNCRKGFKYCTQIGCDCFTAFAKGLLSADHKKIMLEPPSLQFMTNSVKNDIQAYIHKLKRIIEAHEREVEYQSNAYDALASEVREWFGDRPTVAETVDLRCYPALAIVLEDGND